MTPRHLVTPLRAFRRLLGRHFGRSRPAGAVLMYHRVAETPVDPHGLVVTPHHLAEHLEVLRRRWRPTPLARLAGDLARGVARPDAVAITFDDGYRDTLTAAQPLLQRFDMPATVFVTAGLLDQPLEPWRMCLERALLSPGVVPSRIDIEISGSHLARDLAGWERYTEADWRRHAAWRYDEPVADPTPRHALYRDLFNRIVPLPPAERERAAEAVARWGGIDRHRLDGEPLLSVSDLRALSSSAQIDIGAHSVTHPYLTSLDDEGQRREITSSRRMLEDIVGRPVTAFSYPYGAASPATAGHVRGAGYQCACSTARAPLSRASDLFMLPRVSVGHPVLAPGTWDGDALERVLRWIA